MKKFTQSIVVALAMVLTVGALSANAQIWLDQNEMPVINPNSSADLSVGGPQFKYYQETGAFTIVNSGANGIVDSTDNITLAGDDYGMISLLITGNAAVGAEVTASLGTFVDGIGWNEPTFFAGKIQLSGQGFGANFLPVLGEETEIFSLASGLTAADFEGDSGLIEIETGVNFASGQPGATLFSVGDPIASGAFTVVVPEPTSVVLFGTALMGLFGIYRRKK